MDAHQRDRTARELVRTVRERRFARALECPRCDSESVIRWGQFSGRQRYRCRSCNRCFSDLTDTAFSHIKRLGALPSYCGSLNASETVRRAATTARISVSTSFRWRHRFLQSAHAPNERQLAGVVEFAELSLPYSDKGYRRGKAPPWTPAMYFGSVPLFARPGCIVVLAVDRHGGHIAERLDTGTLTGWQLQTLFSDAVSESASIVCNSGRYGPYAWLQPTKDGSLRHLVRVPRHGVHDLGLHHNRNARGWLRRFSGWLVRFRGVATRYLPSYLEWQRVLDLNEAGPWLVRLIPLANAPNPPTTPDNSGAGAAEPFSPPVGDRR